MATAHSGHRQRMRSRVRRFGLESLEDHEVLELLLFYVIPRKNTNPTAHELLNRFGSLENVIGAPVSELQDAGLNKQSAFWLHCLGEYIDEYIEHFLSENGDPDRVYNKVLDCVKKELADSPSGSILAVLLDVKGNIIHTEHLPRGISDKDCVRDVCKAAAGSRAYYAVIAQTYAQDCLFPSEYDCQFTAAYYQALKAMGVKLIDRVFVSPYYTRSFYEMGAFFKTADELYASEYYALMRMK